MVQCIERLLCARSIAAADTRLSQRGSPDEQLGSLVAPPSQFPAAWVTCQPIRSSTGVSLAKWLVLSEGDS